VDVRVENKSGERIHVEPGKIDLVLLGPEGESPEERRSSDGGPGLGLPIDAAVAGAKIGSSAGGRGSGGSGNVVGGVVGAGVGLALAGVVLLPLGIYAIIDAAILAGEKDVDPGRSGTYRLELARVPIDKGGRYALRLDRALSRKVGSLEPLPLTNLDKPHLGYGPPERATWVFVGRVGGGAIRSYPVTAGLGGLELYMGPQFGRFSFGGYAMIGAGSIGGEMRYRFEPSKVVSIVPFVGYGYYHVVGILGFNAGHGGHVGTEILFSTGDVTRGGWSRPGSYLGIYAHAGPVYVRRLEALGFAGQLGLAFGFL